MSWLSDNLVQETLLPNRSGLFLDVKPNFDECAQHIVQSMSYPNPILLDWLQDCD